MTNHPADGTRCPRCPLAPGSPCAGVDVPRLCQLVDPEHPDHDPSYLSALPVRVDSPPGDDAPPRRPLAETLRLLREMKACPHRDERTDCGCAGSASCSRGRGREGVVRIAECFECLDPRASDDARPQRERRPP
jgi:hypothetical protein